MHQNGHFHPVRPVLPWRRTHVETRVLGPPLTMREREVAQLIGRGLTNRQIADELRISDRTVGAHVQNILNKLGATNRAQIAAWAAGHVEIKHVHVDAPAAPVPVVARSRTFSLSPTIQVSLLVLAAVVLTVAFPADRPVWPPSVAAAVDGQRGDLVFEAHFDPNAGEFTPPYVLDDPAGSQLRFVDGGLQYTVLKSGGNTGNGTAIPAMSSYFAEFGLRVKAGSAVHFWISLNTDQAQHLIDIDTAVESMQLVYFIGGDTPFSAALGNPASIDGLQSGREFAVSVLVQPPHYRVYLDGVRVIDVRHQSPRGHMAPGFGIFGDRGTVTLSAVRVYTVA